jgi:hypothetical protein
LQKISRKIYPEFIGVKEAIETFYWPASLLRNKYAHSFKNLMKNISEVEINCTRKIQSAEEMADHLINALRALVLLGKFDEESALTQAAADDARCDSWSD